MSKVAIISANIGSIDLPHPIPEQDTPFDYHLYKDDDLAFLPPEWDSRKKSKYPKMQAHKLLPDYDVYIWMDASVKVTSPQFIFNALALLEGKDMVLTTHPQRQSVKEEFEFMLKRMRAGDEYLNSRFTEKEIQLQSDWFYPEVLPLFSAGISVRYNNIKTNVMMDEWWELTLQYGNYDQAIYSAVIMWYDIQYNLFDFHNPFFKVLSHYKR